MADSFSDQSYEDGPDQFYHKKLVRELQPDDSTVQIVGYVRNKNPSEEFYLDDLTGKIHVREIPEEAPQIKEGELIRVLGKYAIDGAGASYLAAQIIQLMEALDFKAYIKSIQKMREIP